MAIALVFRVAIQLGIAAYRICAGPTLDPQTCANRLRSAWDILTDPDKSASEAEDALNAGAAPEEGVWVVTDYAEPFELRKLQWRLSRAPAGRVEDVDVMSFHFIKATGATPGTWNDSVDLPAVEGLFNTFATWLKATYPAYTHSDQYRWYKDGPAFYHSESGKPIFQPNGDNPAIRITEVDVVGTATGSNGLPPQCAISITEKTSSRKHWGRFYIPLWNPALLDATGLVSATSTGDFRDQIVTLYNGCRSAGIRPVVFSLAKNERPKAGGGTLPATGAVAYEILSVQVDDIVDVVRRRRYDHGVTKVSTALT